MHFWTHVLRRSVKRLETNGSPIAEGVFCQITEVIRDTLGLWPGQARFLDDGHLELDTKPVEPQSGRSR